MKGAATGDLPLAPWDEQLVYSSRIVSIGRFRALPDEPHFRFSGLPGAHLFVFPHHEVWIENQGDEPFVADRSCVTFYNPAQIYQRRAISRHGDRGDWFALAPGVLEEILARHDREGATDGDRLFRFRSGPADDRSFHFQRSLLGSLDLSDPLLVDEGSIRLADRVIGAAYVMHGSRDRARSSRDKTKRHRETVEATKDLLSRRYREKLTVEEIASSVGCSAFHLCRVFRSRTGLTVHRYRTLLRQRQALQELLDGRPDLTDLALDLGYSSHSHFTHEFRRTFGSAPSRIRAVLPRQLLATLAPDPGARGALPGADPNSGSTRTR